MKFLLLPLLFLTFYSNGQTVKEFEGVIEYKQTVVFTTTDPQLDTARLREIIGASSTFYYRNGNYKWIISPTQTEYFDGKTQTVFFLENNSDTLFRSSPHGYDDSLVLFKDSVTEKIAGFICKTATTVSFTKNKPYSPFVRIISYSANVAIDPAKFKDYRTFASNKVIEKTKSWPLKIQLKTEFLPFILTMEAVKIERRKLNDAEVLMPTDKIVVDRF